MTHTFNTASAIRARIVGEWSNADLKAYGPLAPRAFVDVCAMLENEGTPIAMALRRLLMLADEKHAGVEDLLAGLTKPNIPVTLPGMLDALIETIMDTNGGGQRRRS